MARPMPYGGYIGEPKPGASATESEDTLSPKKTLFVLVVVVGCFAVLWPKLFYPMLVANANNQMKPNSFDKGCCDVIHLKDVETIQIMSELCKDITLQYGNSTDSLDPKKMINHCQKVVLDACGIDISAVLQERVDLGHSVKQIVDEVRSLNGSLCLKYNFGLSPSRLGVPHIRVAINHTYNIRQERPPHLRPEIMHPAFRERGKAIPHPELSVTKRPSSQPPPRIVEGRPGPIPGMRPGLGGPGHVVQKHQSNGMMGFLMPIYTIGFVIFFTYTLMKIAFKKKPEICGDEYLYPEVDPDDRFREQVFESGKYYGPQQHRMNGRNQSETKIVVNAVAALLDEVDQEIHARKTVSRDISKETLEEQEEVQPNGSAFKDEKNTIEEHLVIPPLNSLNEEIQEQTIDDEEDQPIVAVMGMETTVSSEDGRKWSRPDSPVLPHYVPERERQKEAAPPPQEIYLEATLPPDSQILVANSATETEPAEEDDSAVVLAGKMTLSVISLDSENDTIKSSDEDRKSSSGNTSEDFEKIDATQLEEQINDIIQAAHTVLLDENDEQFEKNNINNKIILEDKDITRKSEGEIEKDVLEEIKNQLQVEDELLEAILSSESKADSLPVTDIVKEFLTEEENIIIEPMLQKRESKVQFTSLENKNEPKSLREIAEGSINEEEITILAQNVLDDIEKELQDANLEEIQEFCDKIDETDENPIKSNQAEKQQKYDEIEKSIESLRYEASQTKSELFIPTESKNELVLSEEIFTDLEKKEEPVEFIRTEVSPTKSEEKEHSPEYIRSKESPRKSEERFIPQQDSSENRSGRKKKRQDRLKRDLEALTSSVEEAKSFSESFETNEELTKSQEDLNDLDLDELSKEELELLLRYQDEQKEMVEETDQSTKDGIKRDIDQASEKSFDSTDTVKEGTSSDALKENEYLFGSKEQKSLLAALDVQQSPVRVAAEPKDVGVKEERSDSRGEIVEIHYEDVDEEEDIDDEEIEEEEDEQEEDPDNIENEEDEASQSEGEEDRSDERLNNRGIGENRLNIANGNDANVENEISDEDDIENDEVDEEGSEEIEEIIEYVDNTDEEGEEIVDDEVRNGHH